MGKTMCFTGHRPGELYGYDNKESYDVLFSKIRIEIEQMVKEGYTHFISGGAQGFDQLCFWAVNSLKAKYPEIINEVYVPCAGQDESWAENGLFGRNSYKQMLAKATSAIILSKDKISPELMLQRNRMMIDHSDAVMCLYADDSWKTVKHGGTAYSMKYAFTKNVAIHQLKYDKEDINNTIHRECIKEPVSLFGISKGVICQQVNCQGVMGAGVAKKIADTFPVVKQEFDEDYKHYKGLQFGQTLPVQIADELYVACIYSQDKYGNPQKTGEKYTDLDTLLYCIKDAATGFYDKNIYVIKNIGCGYGGESWENVIKGIKEMNKSNIYILDTKEEKVVSVEEEYNTVAKKSRGNNKERVKDTELGL